MPVSGYRTTRLMVTAAVIELLSGVSFYAFPAEFKAAAYSSLRPFLAYVAAGLLTGGVVLLMLTQYRTTRWLERLLVLLPAAPLLLLAESFGHAGRLSAVVSYGLMAAALVAAPWLRQGTGDWMAVTQGTIQILIGLLFLTAPSQFTYFRANEAFLALAGAAGLICGAGLLLCGMGIARFQRRLWQLTGAILPLLLAYRYLLIGQWTGSIYWLVWCSLLATSAGLRLVPEREPVAFKAGELAGDDLPARLERMLEHWLWAMALTVVIVTTFVGGSMAPVLASLFILAVCGYNLLVFQLLPHWGSAEQRLIWHLGFLTVSIGLLLADPGPIGNGAMAPFLMIIPLTARTLGARAGLSMTGLGSLVLLLSGVVHWHFHGMSLMMAAEESILEIAGLAAAAAFGISSAIVQRRAAASLAEAQVDLRREVQRRALTEQVSTAIRSSLDLDATLKTTVEELGKALKASRCLIRLRDGERLAPPSQQYAAAGVEPLRNYQPQSLSHLLFESRQMLVISDLAKDPLMSGSAEGERAYLLSLGIRAMMIAPILAEGEQLGVLILHQAEPRLWSNADLRVVEAVAGQAAVAIAHGRAHQQLAQSLNEVQAGHEELQAANEELQAANEELVAQQEELQSQGEELQAQTEELLDQSQSLQAQQVQLEEALEQARQAEAAHARLSAILEATSDLVAMSDVNGKRLYMNRAGRRLIGFPEDGDVAGLPIVEVHPEWAKQVVSTVGFPTAIANGIWQGESAYLSHDGREIPVSQVIISHRGPDGSVRYLSTVVRDMSAQKQAESQLRESEERFRSTFGNAAIGMAIISMGGIILEVNQSLCETLGYRETELTGQSALLFIDSENDAAERGLRRQLLQGEIRSYQAERGCIHKDGHSIPVLLTMAAVADSEGRPRHFLTQIQDITDRKRFETQLLHMANFDPLTDLFNRRRFEEELGRHLALSMRYGTMGALLFIDLDQFKYINDSLGHQAGDLFLKGLAAMLRRRLRQTDVVARLGGDEFAILLPETNLEQARVVADDLRRSIRQYTQMVGGQLVSTTASIGIAIFPEHGQVAEDLLSRADMAMYQAKEHGRNQSYVCSPDAGEEERAESKLTWERRIREALDHDKFVLHAQPIRDLHLDRTRHHELLLRMQGDQGELIPPKAFLDTAERFGLIRAVDRWVVTRAIRLVAERSQRDPDIVLEVNLSGRAFDDPELLSLISRELNATGINPHSLVFEITETAAISDIESAGKFVKTLKQLGCQFAIDDFGSGFASFYYLKHLPVDYLKIDGSFIHNLPNDPVDQHLVKGIVEVARGLGKKTMAEFVQDEATIRLLKEYGVDFAQGYYIGEPAAFTD
ncbi:MAG: EAL domain-containing protein [Mycobacterium leprae]